MPRACFDNKTCKSGSGSREEPKVIPLYNRSKLASIEAEPLRYYASRLIDGKLIFYTPLYFWPSAADPFQSFPAVRKWHTLFLRGRIFALCGYELVEGALADGQIREMRRVNYAPQRFEVTRR